MKRSLVIVPFILLVLLNACDGGNIPQLSPAQWTAIVATQEVLRNSREERLQNWLNAPAPPEDRFAALEQSLVGSYPIDHVSFPSPDQFRVDIRCMCARGSQCCNPEQMFFIALRRLSLSQEKIVNEVPTSVQWFSVVCFNEQQVQLDVIYASWERVKDFLQGRISASEMDSYIYRQ